MILCPLAISRIYDCVIELTYFQYIMRDVWERFVNVHIWNMINNTYLHIAH